MKTKYDIAEKVNIIELEKTAGVISSIVLAINGILYSVRYFSNGQQMVGEFFEDELNKVKEK